MSKRSNKRSQPVQKAGEQKTIGAPGVPLYGGYILEDETSSSLTGKNKYRTYSNLLANVSIVAAGVRYFQNLVSHPSWKSVPADDSAEAQKYADLVDEILDDMATPMHRVVKRAAMMRFYGFSVQEITAKRREDGTLGIEDIAPRSQKTIERWQRDPKNGAITGCYQRIPQSGKEVFIPRDKMFYVVDDSLNDSPEGLGLFRHVAEPARKLQRYEQLEGFGYESDLRGIPIGRAPLEDLSELPAAEQTQALAAIKQFMKNHVKSPELALLLDSKTYETQDEAARASNVKKWDVDLLKSSANSQPEVLRSIERLNREIARVLGVEQILLGDHSGGSFALASEKSHSFALMIDGTLKELRSQFYSDVITFLFRINGWPMDLRPKMQADRLQTRRVEEVTSALRDMAQAGAVMAPDDPAINAVRDLLGLPEADLDQAAEDASLLDQPEPNTEPSDEEPN